MKNKNGNVAVIAIIIVIMTIATSIITWLVVTKMQSPIQDKITTQQQAKSVIQTQTDAPSQDSKLIPENAKTFSINGIYVKGPLTQKEWAFGPRGGGVYFIADNIHDLPSGANLNKGFSFSNEVEELFGLKKEIVDNGNGNICGFSGKATIEISNYKFNDDPGPVSNDSAKLNRIVEKEPYSKNCFNFKDE